MKLPCTLILSSALLLGACSQDIPLPPAKPLTATAEQLAAIPGINPGPLAVHKGEPRDWALPEGTLRVRVVRPQGDGPYPLVVFSHGFASDVDQYDALFEHWASHGYLIVAPYHLDGGGVPRAIFNSLRKGNLGLVAARVHDLQQVLDHLDALDQMEPGLAARIDRERIAMAGHSFGAFSAQQFAGAVAVDPDSGERVEARDDRVRAVVALSPPGEMFDVINSQSWLSMNRPMLATTGTWDVDGRFVTEWQQHTLSYNSAKPGKNWLLVVEGADHYLGNLICRTKREQPPQTDALRMVNAAAVSFLDAYLKDEPANVVFRVSAATLGTLTNGFAQLSQR